MAITGVDVQCSCGYLNVKTLRLGPEKKSKVLLINNCCVSLH